MTEEKVTRRGYMKYAGAGIVVVAAAGAGAYYATRPTGPAATETTEITETTPTTGPTYGGTLLFFFAGEPAPLNPITQMHDFTLCVSGAVFDRLLWRDLQNTLHPDLAKALPTVSADGKTYTFDLVENAIWHDGEPFTADDVVFTFADVAPKGCPSYETFYGAIDNVTALDKHSVEFKLKQSDPDLLVHLSQVYGASILPKHLFEGVDINNNPYDQSPIGTGPFIFKEWQKGTSITVEKNPEYFMQGKPYLDKIIFRVVTSESAAFQAYKTGELDYLWNISYSTSLDWKSDPNTDLGAPDSPMLPMWKFQWNLRNPISKGTGDNPVAKKEVRQALYHATNMQELFDKVYYGYGKILTGPLADSPFMHPHYNPNVKRYPYDVEKAKQLLDQAGYTEDSSGKRFKLVCKLPNFAPFITDVELVRAQWAKIGVEMENLIQEDMLWLEDNFMFKEGDIGPNFQMNIGYYWGGPTPTDAMQHLESRNMIAAYFFNNMGYSNPRVDELMDKQKYETDVSKRAEMLGEVQSIVMEDPPELYQVCVSSLNAWPKWFHNMPIPVNSPAETYIDVWTEKPR